MATKLEIISIAPTHAYVALYYPIAAPIIAADDQSRVPLGTRLSAQELQDLKDGTLFEFDKSVSIASMSKAQARTHLESLWDNCKAQAETHYAVIYRDTDFIGLAWDGTSWS